MSIKRHDSQQVTLYGPGNLVTAGSASYRYRVGALLYREGVVKVYEEINRREQLIVFDTVLHGLRYTRTETRTRPADHATERGIKIMAGRWIRSLAAPAPEVHDG